MTSFVECGNFIFVIVREVLLSVQSVQHKSYLPSRLREILRQLFRVVVNKKMFNALLFQLGWFACILGGDSIALIAVAGILIIHGGFYMVNKQEWLLIAAMTLLGLLMDNALAFAGVFTFKAPELLYIPVWLLCIWVLFALTLNHSLKWLQSRLLLASLLGAVSAPMSYLAGSKLADVELLDPVYLSLLPIAMCWAIILPLAMLALRRQ